MKYLWIFVGNKPQTQAFQIAAPPSLFQGVEEREVEPTKDSGPGCLPPPVQQLRIITAKPPPHREESEVHVELVFSKENHQADHIHPETQHTLHRAFTVCAARGARHRGCGDGARGPHSV
ncbi:hypothetical protein H920_05284 [Fukomys damarensis]|uniref:Uncharacterized protein n=1 Tax=Fukomys damarensis TaxID=885580 RepID=A0A091ECQ7_FUKDA|nr:hypothetical protein H920_05284 [Fukomys damarensis]